jgi:glycosyltransferase involved in cell wall biosynthesis
MTVLPASTTAAMPDFPAEERSVTQYRAGLISVIMPCYDSAAYLQQAMESVLGQSYRDVELLLVDDGSSDDSPRIAARLAQEHAGRVTLLRTHREGPYPARNVGLARAQGEFVAFLDADDYWSPHFLERLHAALVDSAAVLAYCGWQNIGATDRTNEPYVPPDLEQGDKLELLLRAASPWPIHAALVRRKIVDEVGGFDTTLATCMDYDLWLRISASRPITRVPEVLAYYRFHSDGQITSKQWRQAENVWRVKKKFVDAYPHLTARFPRGRLQELIDGALLRRGYDCYWRRDLVSARRIFRRSLQVGGWKLKDLKYLLPALLPEGPYRSLIARVERQDANR